MNTYTIIEYTPSSADYDHCDRAYYSYSESELEIRHYYDYQEVLAAINRADSDKQIIMLINGIPIDEVLDFTEDATIPEQVI